MWSSAKPPKLTLQSNSEASRGQCAISKRTRFIYRYLLHQQIPRPCCRGLLPMLSINHDEFNVIFDAFDDFELVNPCQSWQEWAALQAEGLETKAPDWRAWLAETLLTPTTVIGE